MRHNAEAAQLLVLHSSLTSKLIDNFEGLLVHFSEVSEYTSPCTELLRVMFPLLSSQTI